MGRVGRAAVCNMNDSLEVGPDAHLSMRTGVEGKDGSVNCSRKLSTYVGGPAGTNKGGVQRVCDDLPRRVPVVCNAFFVLSLAFGNHNKGPG